MDRKHLGTSCKVRREERVSKFGSIGLGLELLSRQVKVQPATDPNRPTCLDSRRPLLPGPGAHPCSLPFTNSRGSAEGRPALDSYSVPTLTNLRAAYGGAAQEFDICRVQ